MHAAPAKDLSVGAFSTPRCQVFAQQVHGTATSVSRPGTRRPANVNRLLPINLCGGGLRPGISSQLTPRWREPDSNRRSHLGGKGPRPLRLLLDEAASPRDPANVILMSSSGRSFL
jgi:hypothetical protein